MAEQRTDLADLATLSVSTAVTSAITEALVQRQRQFRGEAGSAVQAGVVPTLRSRASSNSR